MVRNFLIKTSWQIKWPSNLSSLEAIKWPSTLSSLEAIKWPSTLEQLKRVTFEDISSFNKKLFHPKHRII